MRPFTIALGLIAIFIPAIVGVQPAADPCTPDSATRE